MSPEEIVHTLLSRGIRLQAEGGRLVVNAPAGALTEELRANIKAQKADILAFLQEAGSGSHGMPPPPSGPLPEATGQTSFTQDRIWAVSRMDPTAPHYCLAEAFRLCGPLNESALESGLQAFCDQHELTRARFLPDERGVLRLLTEPARTMVLERFDIDGDTPEEVEERACARMEARELVPVDPGSDFLFRACLLRLGPEHHLLHIVTHAMIWDASSFEILLDQIGIFYEQQVNGSSPSLPAPRLRYDDYAWWQRELHRSPEIQAGIEYWVAQLSGELEALPLPVDYAPGFATGKEGARYNFTVSARLTQQVRRYCRTAGVTPFMVFLAAYALLLSRYGDKNKVLVTTLVHGRDHASFDGMIGSFSNNIFLKIPIDEADSFDALVGQVRHIALEAFSRQRCAVEAILGNLRVDVSQTALFQLNFTYLSEYGQPRNWAGIVVSLGPARNTRAVHGDLSLWIREAGPTMEAGLDYRSDRFGQNTIGLMANRLLSLLERLLAEPDAMLRNVSVDSAAPVLSGTSAGVEFPESAWALRCKKVPQYIGLSDGGSLLLAIQGDEATEQFWHHAAGLAQVEVQAISAHVACDERRLYAEVMKLSPQFLVTTAPMALAMAELDSSAASLSRMCVVINPVHVERSVLATLARAFAKVIAVVGGDPRMQSYLLASVTPDGLVSFEAWPDGTVPRVTDRLGRVCLSGAEGMVELLPADGAVGERHSAGCRGFYQSDGAIRATRWEQDPDSRTHVTRILEALNSLPGIQDCHVEFRRRPSGEKRLFAWIVQALGRAGTVTELRAHLLKSAPGLDCPAFVLDAWEIPRKPDGSIMSAKLPDPFAGGEEYGFEPVRPGVEETIARIWAEVLGIARVGAHDSFSELGGESLQALRVIGQMQASLGWRVEPRLLFFQSLRQIAGRAPKSCAGDRGQP